MQHSEVQLPFLPSNADSAMPDMTRIAAISLVLAKSVGTLRMVQWFRLNCLPFGMLMGLEAVPRWIARTAKAEGEPSVWLSGVAVEEGNADLAEDGTLSVSLDIHSIRFVQSGEEIFDDEPSFSYRLLRYYDPNGESAVVAVHAYGTLYRLRHLSNYLASWLRWQPEQAASFIITGRVPLVSESDFPFVPVKGQRPQDEKHLRLAVFDAEHVGQPLATRMSVWNALFPQWSYNRTSNFSWDSREARRRLGVEVESPIPTYAAVDVHAAFQEQGRQAGRKRALWGDEIPDFLRDAEKRGEREAQHAGTPDRLRLLASSLRILLLGNLAAPSRADNNRITKRLHEATDATYRGDRALASRMLRDILEELKTWGDIQQRAEALEGIQAAIDELSAEEGAPTHGK